MQETWKRFVYPLIEDKKQDVEEETYHRGRHWMSCTGVSEDKRCKTNK